MQLQTQYLMQMVWLLSILVMTQCIYIMQSIDDKEHPKQQFQTGLEMLKAVEKFNEKITVQGLSRGYGCWH